MVYIINYMSVLAGAGIMTEDVFQSFANLKDTYGIRDSARSIVRDIGLLGKDIISAIEAEAKRYFRLDDGTPLFLNGLCVCWHGSRGTYDYDDWLASCQTCPHSIGSGKKPW